MRRHRNDKGFTLIEIMVVVVIVGIIAGVITINTSTENQSAYMFEESQRVKALLNLAKQEAILNNQELSIVMTETEYGFQVLEGETWQPLENEVLRIRRLRPDMLLAVEMEDIELVIGKKQSEEEVDSIDDKPIRAYILSSGEMTPFTMVLRNDDESLEYRIVVTEDGESKIIEPGDGDLE